MDKGLLKIVLSMVIWANDQGDMLLAGMAVFNLT